jgi:hypothetical protein
MLESAVGHISIGTRLFNSDGWFEADVMDVKGNDVQLQFWDGIVMWVDRNVAQGLYVNRKGSQ